MAEKDIMLETAEGAGEIKIASEVLMSIAAQAALGISGITLGSAADSFMDKLVKKAATSGVKVNLSETENTVEIDMHISIHYGVNIREIAWEIQEAVKKNVEAMTDITVNQVHIFVDGVILEKEPKPEKPKKAKPAKKAETKSAEEPADA